MTLSTNSGTGLRANKSPSGIKLASSEFTAQPNEEVAAIDVYKVSQPGVVTSVVEDTTDSFFGNIANALTGGKVSLPKLSSLNDLVGAAKKGLGFARDAMNTVSRVQSSMNRLQNGGINGILNTLKTASDTANLGWGPGLNNVRNAVNGINQGGIRGLSRAADSILGGNNNALSSLGSNIASVTTAVDRVRNAGNISSMISSLDYATNTVGRSIDSLDKASQTDFYSGYNSVLDKFKLTSDGYNQSALGQVHTSVSEFTESFSSLNPINVTARAGMATGLASLSAELGDNSVLPAMIAQGLDERSASIAATALSSRAITTGNISLLKDLTFGDVNSPGEVTTVQVLRDSVAAVPNVAQAIAATVKPPIKPTPLKDIFDDISEVAQAVNQPWISKIRDGSEVLSTAVFDANEFMTNVLMAKSEDDHFQNRIGKTQLDNAAVLTSAQALLAAKIASSAMA